MKKNWLPFIRPLDAFSTATNAQTAADTLLQSIDLAVEAERLGVDGAYFRVHHFARQLASPFPLLAVVGAQTKKIEIGTAVIDMRYENPHYMAEDASAADLIATGLSLVAIVVGGMMFAYGEGQSKKTLDGIVFGAGMADLLSSAFLALAGLGLGLA
jgi:alkanesulfonate monooxygenase SsuD/methylene tetrahydromethanopterin reductase-like flavin-dependent oxidoreductase (luciferase family)